MNATSEYLNRPTLSERERKLLDLLTLALPYVECAETDPAYRPGVVRALARKMRHAIESAP